MAARRMAALTSLSRRTCVIVQTPLCTGKELSVPASEPQLSSLVSCLEWYNSKAGRMLAARKNSPFTPLYDARTFRGALEALFLAPLAWG